MSSSQSKVAIIAAIAANLALAICKFVAAAFTGSSAMLSEGIHSSVDTGNQALLLLGTRLSKRPPDELHPFGHGLDLYFWTLIVALFIFGVGGGVSIYEGILHIIHPQEVESVAWSYSVLGLGILFEGTSWGFALHGFLKSTRGRSMWTTVRNTKDPTLVAVLFEDSAALVGLVVAFVGIYLGRALHAPFMDGVASIVIGLILMSVASILAFESRKLLIGESADPAVVRSIHDLVLSDPAVERASPPLTLHFGPDNVLVNLDVDFHADLTLHQIESAIDRLESAIRTKHPRVRRVFLEARSIVPSQPATDHADHAEPIEPS